MGFTWLHGFETIDALTHLSRLIGVKHATPKKKLLVLSFPSKKKKREKKKKTVANFIWGQ